MIFSKTQTTYYLSPMTYLFGVLKFVVFVTLMIFFILHHGLVELIFRSKSQKLSYYLRSLNLTSKLCLWILNVKVSRIGVGGEVTQRLIVANHLSYIDVLILFSHYPSLFVTSVEMKEVPVLGTICQLAGCFFVERRKEKRDEKTKEGELLSMKEKLSQGYNIFLFPEGTSSDGTEVLPFKNTFFQLAIDAKSPVKPICLKYTGVSREFIPWYGKMTFMDHLFKVCLQKEISAELISLADIAGECRYSLATSSHQIISETYAKY